MSTIQSRNRQEMRQSIGRNMGIVIIGEATSTVDNTSLIDTKWLARGGDDEHNGKQVVIYDAAGSIVDGETSFVSDFAAATYDATCTPAFSASIADGDKYELWQSPWTKEDIDDIINQCISAVSGESLLDKETHDTFTESEGYVYNCLSGFAALHTVEYCAGIGTEFLIDNCETAMTAGANVTATADTSFKKEGNTSAKLVMAAGAGVQLLAYGTISSIDLSQCDKVELWIYSSVALDAGDLQLQLDNTAACASALETIDIPATTAATWTRHVISLANPHLDTAIISWGIYQAVDKGACTVYVDYVKAVKDSTRQWTRLNPQQWFISKGTTPYLNLTASGKSVTGDNTLLRLTGYKIPSLLSSETTDSEIDPAWVIAEATWQGLIGHAKSSSVDINDRKGLADRWKAEANTRRASIRANILPDTRWC
jgi:hypothetical protein